MKNNNYISTTLIKSVKKNIITLLVFLIWSEGFTVFKINYYAKYKWTSFSKISWGTPDGEKIWYGNQYLSIKFIGLGNSNQFIVTLCTR